MVPSLRGRPKRRWKHKRKDFVYGKIGSVETLFTTLAIDERNGLKIEINPP